MLSELARQWVISHGFDPDHLNFSGQYQDTALIQACRRGESLIAKELISAGAEINHRNMDGTDALWACAVSDSFEIAEILLANGANINNQNDNGASVLMYA